MDAVFTIVAKNYLAQARTLGDSLKQVHPDLAFYVFLADEAGGYVDLAAEKYQVIESKDIGIDSYLDMAFRYNVVEFATAIKPCCLAYLFDRLAYDKVVYFDPDIYVYSSLDSIFDALDRDFVMLTPHITELNVNDEGARAEENLLYEGTYNLGFIALKRCEEADLIVEWWRTRLKDKCYADRFGGLHVDQKWMELIPGFFDNGVIIARHPGYNAAVHNIHQRSLEYRNGTYLMNGQPLVFFHFAGFDPDDPDSMTGPHKQTKFDLRNKPEYRNLFCHYARHLEQNSSIVTNTGYTYANYEDGTHILGFQRRLYRRLTENGLTFDDPFSVETGSYYDLLRRNRLLISSHPSSQEYRRTDFANVNRKLSAIKSGMKLLKNVIGIKYYHLLLRLLVVLCRPEEQVFLIETLDLDLPIRFRE